MQPRDPQAGSHQADSLSPEDIQELRRESLRSLYFFARSILGFTYMVPQVHGPVCDFLESKNRRKQITMPRGFIKTSLCSIAYPIWRVLPPDSLPEDDPYRSLHDPNTRILIAMKTLPNAQRTIQEIRDIFERNDLFRSLFPEILPDPRRMKWSNDGATINRSGYYRECTFEPAGIGTNLTSRHYNLIIEDDLVAPKKDDMTGLEAMPTREEVEEAIGWHKLARSLFDTPRDGELLNVGTRWAKYDLIQYIIDNEPHTERLEIDSIDESGDEPVAVYPERFPLETLREIEIEQGTYIFSSQYRNKPYDEASMVFKDEWLQQRWSELPEGMRKCIIVDPAGWGGKAKEGRSNSVVLVAGAHEGKLYALDYYKGRGNPSEVIDEMFRLSREWETPFIYVETVAWQEGLKFFFEKEAIESQNWLVVEDIRPGRQESKDTRIRGLQPFAKNGALILAPWMRDLISELRDFPFSATKDLADALAYAPRCLDIGFTSSKPRTPTRRDEGPETMGDVIDFLHRKARRTRFGFRDPVTA